ncbi:MAG: hypothetical protein QW290_09180 [Sulfolobales archaeon]
MGFICGSARRLYSRVLLNSGYVELVEVAGGSVVAFDADSRSSQTVIAVSEDSQA